MSDDPSSPITTPTTAGRVRAGLCSVTFRSLTAEQVVELAASAGLESIEWGSDVHARPDDLAELDRVRRLTEDAGLVVASYGSYYRAEPDGGSRAQPAVLTAAAVRLGARRIRVWAGHSGSADATAQQRADTVAELVRACDIAADGGAALALEFHRGTLTDTVASTRQLLGEVGRDNLSSSGSHRSARMTRRRWPASTSYSRTSAPSTSSRRAQPVNACPWPHAR